MTEAALLKQRIRRAANGNATTKKYEKTPSGFLMRAYRNMKSRVTGVQRLKKHLYFGLPILDKADFYVWSLKDDSFLSLFEVWKANKFERKLTPSIDRIDSKLGYIQGNIRWITHSQNSRLGNQSRFSRQISTSASRRSN